MAALDWIVFGDDWGRHPSTTQHLVAHLPPADRVTWIDSIGMRAPGLAWADLARVVERARGWLRGGSGAGAVGAAGAQPARRVRPLVLPWHEVAAARRVNRALLARAVAAPPRGVVLAANPVATYYCDVLSPRRVIYLRLDRYAELPGVDAALVASAEAAMMARADLVVAPSERVLAGAPAEKARVLPQGVDLARFAAVPAEPPATRVCGYWGWLGEWLDRDLVRAVAAAHPDWTFELRGPSRLPPAALALGPNVVVLPAVPHEALAGHAAHWRAAWAPLRATHHMALASPLKLREYLAAGLPTASTPLPELTALPAITEVRGPPEVAAFLADALTDDAARRAARRASVAGEGWDRRAATLRAWADDGERS